MKLLKEQFVQKAVIEYLFRKGWGRNMRAKGLKERGVDIQVRHNRYARYWLIEVKGDASPNAKYPRSHREVNFNLAIGQITTRMHTAGKSHYKYGRKYGIAFPGSFKRLVVKRLPYDICHKLNLFVFLVNKDSKVELLSWKELKKLQS